MSPKVGERIFERTYGLILLEIAKEDLESSRGLHSSNRGRPENVVFLAQQAIEKALKAVLCHLGLPVPLVHEDIRAALEAGQSVCDWASAQIIK